jgi:hypothetical protein
MMRRYGMMRGMCQCRAMLLGPCVGRLGLQQPHQRQTQRHTPKRSNDDPHLDGEHINKMLLAKTLVAVAHPVNERYLGAFRASWSHRTQEQAPSQAAYVHPSCLPDGGTARLLRPFRA